MISIETGKIIERAKKIFGSELVPDKTRKEEHLEDLRIRLQDVCDRVPPQYSKIKYGVISGVRQNKKKTRAQIRKEQDTMMGVA